MFAKEQYDQAIENLKLGLTQLEPNGNCCHICGDNGHQAWECNFNPLKAYNQWWDWQSTWRCFHCNEVFFDEEKARKHFGNIPEATPHCVIKKCLCLKCSANPIECSGKG